MNVAVLVVILTVVDGELRVLLIHRSGEPAMGTWALPGGFPQAGESLADAAARKLGEETGVGDVYLEQLFTFDGLDEGAVILQKKTPVVTSTFDDAALVVEARDAAVETPLDAPVIVELPSDAGTKVVTAGRDAGVGVVQRPGRRDVTIEVLTRPGEANVYIGLNFRGPSGVRITEPLLVQLRRWMREDGIKSTF